MPRYPRQPARQSRALEQWSRLCDGIWLKLKHGLYRYKAARQQWFDCTRMLLRMERKQHRRQFKKQYIADMLEQRRQQRDPVLKIATVWQTLARRVLRKDRAVLRTMVHHDWCYWLWPCKQRAAASLCKMAATSLSVRLQWALRRRVSAQFDLIAPLYANGPRFVAPKAPKNRGRFLLPPRPEAAVMAQRLYNRNDLTAQRLPSLEEDIPLSIYFADIENFEPASG